ncbi:ABC transporter substrate-binding protein [Pararhodospirillum oryzae]|uniref:Fe/B12 periplasmic-binding domain-containing protein n=1 Tax=Pararhodospirillum oryzae TaxID=478448 RepID=A0A512H5N9_9PROT|nr:ABC transporter substrate-binding protein [Pararhodospirillum oryzae]GEO80772.1 hypothetical protein ROR02_09030 [Pararhodospirillum oryzae]
MKPWRERGRWRSRPRALGTATARAGLAALTLVLAGGEACAGPPALPRVASLSVCADQLVLALAAPEQIVSLSFQARDPALSLLAGRARGFARNRGSAEEVLKAGAQVVIGDAGLNAATLDLLTRLGVRTHALGLHTDLAAVDRETARVAALIGRPAEGAALIAAGRALHAAVAADPAAGTVATAAPPARPVVAAYLTPGGGSAGRDTFVDTLMREVGLDNLGARLGRTGWGPLDLELLVRHPPDRFVTSFFENAPPSRQRLSSRHPVLRRLLARTPPTVVESRAWVCSSWILAEAARQLARARAPLDLPGDGHSGPGDRP